MALIKAKDAAKMNKEELEAKMKDVRFELVKANVTAHKASAKTKEIKKTIARLFTFQKMKTEVSAKN